LPSEYADTQYELTEARAELARVRGMVAETLSLATDYALRCSEEKNCAMYKIISALSDGKTLPESAMQVDLETVIKTTLELEQDNEGLRDELEQARAELEEAKTRFREAEVDRDHFRAWERAMSKRAGELQTQLIAAKSRLERLSEERNNANEELARVTEDWNEAITRAVVAENKLDAIYDAIDGHCQEYCVSKDKCSACPIYHEKETSSKDPTPPESEE